MALRRRQVEEIDFVELGSPEDPLGPGTVPNRTYDVVPHAEAADYDDSAWTALAPAETQLRLANGRVCFNWYGIAVTIPERVGDLDPTGATVVFEVVIDDYAEVWVERRAAARARRHRRPGGRRLQRAEPGRADARRAARASVPDRRLRHQRADLGLAAQLHLDAHGDARLLRRRARAASRGRLPLEVEGDPARRDPAAGRALERVAGGFEFTEGPVWAAGRCAALQLAEHERDLPLEADDGRVTVFRSKSGYTGPDIGRYHQPGSNGLTFDPQGRLTICQHGNRRVIRVNPHGDITVLADGYEGRRLNSPNDLVYRSDGTLYFTDPPFGLPACSPTATRARLQRRLPRARRRGVAAHRRARGPERPRVLARRALALRRQLGLRAQRRHALRPADRRRPRRRSST